MTQRKSNRRSFCLQVLSMALVAMGIAAVAPSLCHCSEFVKSSAFDLEHQRVKYEFAHQSLALAYHADVYAGSYASALADDFAQDEESGDKIAPKKKSPVKAFLLSAAVPGAGQWYYGSRIKPFIFLGTEIAAWGLHITWHKDGEDATDAYEAFNREHWSRGAYEQDYLFTVYGETDDDNVTAREVSHHLPETETQQYFEMTGKYDQFAWGWDDARLDGLLLDERISQGSLEAITGPSYTPRSTNRDTYETMRDDANKKFDDARKMIIVSVVNRLVSALEAYFVTKNQADKVHDDEFSRQNEGVLSRLKFSAKLKSYHSKRDTPFVNVTLKF